MFKPGSDTLAYYSRAYEVSILSDVIISASLKAAPVGGEGQCETIDCRPSAEPTPAPDTGDRMEWVRHSYERFIEKMQQLDELRGVIIAF